VIEQFCLEQSASRFERKFFITDLTAREVECSLKRHPACFREVYRPRSVNNVYFDNAEMTCLLDNIDGHGSRLKARIRWYGTLFGQVESPTLEIKIKRGDASWKKSFPANPFILRNCADARRLSLTDIVDFTTVPSSAAVVLAPMEPTVLNAYRRKYFLSADGAYRMTLDTDMSDRRLGSATGASGELRMDTESCILELKYSHADDDNADSISGLFEFRLTKSSKYVSGALER